MPHGRATREGEFESSPGSPARGLRNSAARALAGLRRELPGPGSRGTGSAPVRDTFAIVARRVRVAVGCSRSPGDRVRPRRGDSGAWPRANKFGSKAGRGGARSVTTTSPRRSASRARAASQRIIGPAGKKRARVRRAGRARRSRAKAKARLSLVRARIEPRSSPRSSTAWDTRGSESRLTASRCIAALARCS